MIHSVVFPLSADKAAVVMGVSCRLSGARPSGAGGATGGPGYLAEHWRRLLGFGLSQPLVLIFLFPLDVRLSAAPSVPALFGFSPSPQPSVFTLLVGFRVGNQVTEVIYLHGRSTYPLGERSPSFVKWNHSRRSGNLLSQNLSGLNEVVTLPNLKVNLKGIREGFR